MPFDKHVFLCTNKRLDGTGCGTVGADSAFKEAKQAFADKKPQVRINSSGCLGHCLHGPVLVIYPEGNWYSYFDSEDVVKIVEAHLQGTVESEFLIEE